MNVGDRVRIELIGADEERRLIDFTRAGREKVDGDSPRAEERMKADCLICLEPYLI